MILIFLVYFQKSFQKKKKGILPRYGNVQLPGIAGREAAGIHNDGEAVAGFNDAAFGSDTQAGCAHDIVAVHFHAVRPYPIRLTFITNGWNSSSLERCYG